MGNPGSNGLRIETHCSTASCINCAKRILERFGYSPDGLAMNEPNGGTSYAIQIGDSPASGLERALGKNASNFLSRQHNPREFAEGNSLIGEIDRGVLNAKIMA